MENGGLVRLITLSNLLKKTDQKTIYVSLFGKTSIDEVLSEIYFQLI